MAPPLGRCLGRALTFSGLRACAEETLADHLQDGPAQGGRRGLRCWERSRSGRGTGAQGGRGQEPVRGNGGLIVGRTS